MFQSGAAMKRIAFMIATLLLAALACNFQSEEPVEEPPAPTLTSTSTRQISEEGGEVAPTVGVPETVPANIATVSVQPTETTAPTSTVAQAPTLAPTNTPSPTATRQPAATTTSGSGGSSGDTSGPLSLEVYVEWRFKDAAAKLAIATVTLTAHGGGGGYTYFRDQQQMPGPTFEYEWATCKGNPITFSVTSSSGESHDEVLFLNPPCPTPTPTP